MLFRADSENLTKVLAYFKFTFDSLFDFREVIYNLFRQELRLKYKGTFFGIIWSLLNPLLYLIILSTVFSHVVRLEMEDYRLFLFSGLLAWSFFQGYLSQSPAVFIEAEPFLKKVYLPKIIFPLNKLLIRWFDFLISFVALLILGAFLGFPITVHYLLLFPVFILFFCFSLGAGLMVSIFSVFFRDLGYLINVFLQLLYFITPILYPLSQLPHRYHQVLQWNPITTQIVLFQKIIYFGQAPSSKEWLIASLFSFACLGIGMWVLKTLDDEIMFRL